MTRSLAIFALSGALFSTGAFAQGWPGSSLVPQSEARDAANKGCAIPLAKIQKRLKAQYGGDLSDAVMYTRADGAYFYKVVWITRDGRRLDLEVDAQGDCSDRGR